MPTAILPSLQSRFQAFAVSPAGLALSDLESKALICVYSCADPETELVQLSIGRIARKLKIDGEKIAKAVDGMTAKGILETVKEAEQIDGKWMPAVRRLILTPPQS